MIRSINKPRRTWIGLTHVAALAAALALDGGARADASPVLHEYLEPDANEAVALGATTQSGELPAAIDTTGGPVTPPDVYASAPPSRVYEPGATSESSGFRPDRDTGRPDMLRYDDPFVPTLTPYKRMFAFDAVHVDYSLYVRAPDKRPMPIGGRALAGDDRFFADLRVMLLADEPVRIPTAGPGARLIQVVSSPATELVLLKDGADNWFLRSNDAGRVRIVAELAIERATFESDFPDVDWQKLAPVALQPPEHEAAYRDVARAIGVSRSLRPKQVVTKMVEYFRSFTASDDPPANHGDIYLDLALSKKGVCRHRAFLFLVTALRAGIATRFIHNEAHAWVEVFDGTRWHRVDLGGAAVNLADAPRVERPPHRAPPDRFAWPQGRDSGTDLAHRERAERAETRERERRANDPNGPRPSDGDDGAHGNSDQGNSDQGDGAHGNSDPGNSESPHDPNTPPRPAASVLVESIDRDVFKGKPLRLRGRAEADGAVCANVRIDVLLDAGGIERRIGSLATDDGGIFDGEVVVPLDVPVGDHRLFAATPGNRRCGPGRSP
ncbi:MAG: transglutaminase domain-containing protein [Myxococcales bacterium]|nr:transglutaminase domain-containing protein [Myxococcales bacterium]